MTNLIQQVIVTGSGGWLGRRLVDLLINDPKHILPVEAWAAGFQLRGMLRPHEDISVTQYAESMKYIIGDLRNPVDCARLCSGAEGGVLFHTAGVIHPRRVSEFYAVNRDGTLNILKAAANAGVKRVVVVSSNSPCGFNPTPAHRFDERSPYKPYMNYGRSKMEMEQAVQQMQATGLIETVIVRAPWFYGPFQPPRQTLFFEMIRSGKMPLVGSGETLRSMVYIDNLCQGLFLASVIPAANGQTYWIADRSAYSMNEIINTIEELLEQEFGLACAHKRMRLPHIAGELARFVDAMFQAAGLYHQKIHVLSEMNKNIACKIDKAVTELNYSPQIDLREGMRRSIRWCIENGLLKA